ncbi:MAG: nucleotidyltransferase family protein [Nanoarchaeota archaeon]|nr:nucleotidyltransferase family protein [Nanoarchaeota archaeon]
MKAIILAAGYATRLYPLTLDKPKALLPIKGNPILDYTLSKIQEIGEIDSVFIITNTSFYGILVDYVEKNFSRFSFNLSVLNDGTYSNETRLGGIGDLWHCIREEGINDDVLVLNSDNLFDFSLKGIVELFKQKRSVVNGVYGVDSSEEAKRHGVVELLEDRIVGFEEKPDKPKTLLTSIGVYIFPRDYLFKIGEYLREGNNKDSPGNLVKYFVDRFEVFAYLFQGRLFDIGNLETYKRIDEVW